MGVSSSEPGHRARARIPTTLCLAVRRLVGEPRAGGPSRLSGSPVALASHARQSAEARRPTARPCRHGGTPVLATEEPAARESGRHQHRAWQPAARRMVGIGGARRRTVGGAAQRLGWGRRRRGTA